MKLNWINQIDTTARSVALGTFDGVHRGHQKLLEITMASKPWGGTSCVCTFDIPPEHFFQGKPRLVSSFKRKVELIRDFGIDEVTWLRFGPELTSTEADVFVREILVEQLQARHVICGFNYHFGSKRLGNAQYLQEQGRHYGFEVTVVPPVLGDNGKTISSTLIRQLLMEGDITQATNYLGYFPSYQGAVSQGAVGGLDFGFPAVELEVDPQVVLPAEGVYLTWCVLANQQGQPAVARIRDTQIIEVLILTSYVWKSPQILEIQFLERLRNHVSGGSSWQIPEQVQADVTAARQMLSRFRVK